MIDSETLYQWELDATDESAELIEIIRNARRYLALRKVGVQVPGYELVKFDWSLDAAADRLLEGGE
jgi:hypothetical protein